MDIQRKIIGPTVLLAMLFASQTFSQQNLGRQTILRFDASHSVLKPDAPLLMESVPMEKGKNNARFVSGVGGVSFDKQAVPDKTLVVSSLKLNYNKAAMDGRRLQITINNKPVQVYLPDWLLVPIARYAQSPHYSCVTLFGKLRDQSLERSVTSHKGRVINYHPAFDNTLLGIRLAYLDMLVGYPFTRDLPKNVSGNYLLGTGEKKPDIKANELGAYTLSQHIARVENKYQLTFRSYVITDYTRQITFKTVKDSLVISGFPYYYCWKFKSDSKGYDINKVAQELSASYSLKAQELSKSGGNKAVQDWIIAKIITLGKRYKDNYSFYSEGSFLDMLKMKTDVERRQFLLGFAPESLIELAVNTEAYMDSYTVVSLKEFSNEVSSMPELFEAANPAVWNAGVTTMRFAAFFRYVKTRHPQTWQTFYNQVRLLDPEPRIVTPTIMYNPQNKFIMDAIKKSR